MNPKKRKKRPKNFTFLYIKKRKDCIHEFRYLKRVPWWNWHEVWKIVRHEIVGKSSFIKDQNHISQILLRII